MPTVFNKLLFPSRVASWRPVFNDRGDFFGPPLFTNFAGLRIVDNDHIIFVLKIVHVVRLVDVIGIGVELELA